MGGENQGPNLSYGWRPRGGAWIHLLSGGREEERREPRYWRLKEIKSNRVWVQCNRGFLRNGGGRGVKNPEGSLVEQVEKGLCQRGNPGVGKKAHSGSDDQPRSEDSNVENRGKTLGDWGGPGVC